jgi:serine/threonine-protein kinase
MWSLGRYEIMEQLGQGSMGVVYRARDPVLDRDVAIKRILVQAGDGPAAAEFRDRFFREARAAGRLSHPGIVTVFDVAEHEGTPFIVMEYVAGRTLLSLLESGERMSLDYACDVGIQLAEALDYAHRSGVIHRDIKPANILVTGDGRIKIADFGVAKLIESQLTAKGQLLGTPAFMAPEQFIGMPIDFRSDLFSAGVVIYYMTTCEKPFAGDTVIGVQYKVVHTDPVQPRKLNPLIPPNLDAIIMKSIQKDPLERYRSGEELARALRLYLAGARTATTTDSSPGYERTVLVTPGADADVNWHRRLKAAMVILVSVLITFFAFTVYFVRNARRKEAAIADTSTQTTAQSANPADRVQVASSERSEPVSTELPNDAIAARETDSNETPVETAAPQRSVPDDGHKLERLPATRPAGPAANAALPAKEEQRSVETAVVIPPQREPESQPPLQPVEPLPAKKINEPVGAGSSSRQDSAQLYKPARLLIASAAAPEPLTIIVNVDNELFFSRSGVENREPIPPESAPSPPLSQERPIPPGKHKVQVSVLLESRRVAKVQEVTERFYSGQRRILHIEFLPEGPGSRGRDTNAFKISLK